MPGGSGRPSTSPRPAAMTDRPVQNVRRIRPCLSPARARRVLVCCDDVYHPGAVVQGGLESVLQDEGWTAQWAIGAPAPDAASLAGYAVVVLAKSNVLSAQDPRPWLPPGHACFGDYVRGGGCLLAVHSGIASYDKFPEVQALTGGHFVQHPPACEVALELAAACALTTGVTSAFSVYDEHYFVERTDPDAEVFLISRSIHGRQPAGWTRRERNGRVCVLTPGHFLAVWRHPAFRCLVANALTWLTQAEESS